MKYPMQTLLTLVAILSGAGGCSILKDQMKPRLGAEVVPASAAQAAPKDKYVVELRAEKGQPQIVEQELAAPIHVQQALEQSGAAKKWPRMQVELYRHLPSGGWHRMSLEYDRQSHRIPPEFDYSVLPGDRIIVKEDTANFLDDVMGTALKPLGISTPQEKKKKEIAHKYQVRG
jgi:hypothetical protein